MTILLIEPNHLLAKTYVTALEYAGHSVRWQTNAGDAVLDADAERPSVVILEPQLSGHSGIEFLYEFRSYPDWQGVPVILQSFIPDHLSRGQKQVLGIVDYLYKPATSLQRLTQTINRLSVTAL